MTEDSLFLFMSNRVAEGKGCPRLAHNQCKAVEQILNAVILNNADNLTKGLNYSFQVLQAIDSGNKNSAKNLCFLIPNSGVSIIDFAKAQIYNAATNTYKTYENSLEKQLDIDKDFQTDRKLNFDGKRIRFNDSYYEFVERICFNNSHYGRHNLNDEFYELAVSRFEDFRIDFKSSIPEDLKKYMTNLKKKFI